MVNEHNVTLRDISAQNVRAICALSVSDYQTQYVVSNAIAIAEACYSNNEWLQAIYVGETPAGLAVVKISPDQKSYFLWRLMIDTRYQRQGIGRQALSLLVNHAQRKPHVSEFTTSVVPGDHSPQGFYESLGFKITGESYNGEAVMKLTF